MSYILLVITNIIRVRSSLKTCNRDLTKTSKTKGIFVISTFICIRHPQHYCYRNKPLSFSLSLSPHLSHTSHSSILFLSLYYLSLVFSTLLSHSLKLSFSVSLSSSLCLSLSFSLSFLYLTLSFYYNLFLSLTVYPPSFPSLFLSYLSVSFSNSLFFCLFI